jgi:release factor glutamine methyltransferase
MDIKTLLFEATRELVISGSSSPRLDADILLMNLLKSDRASLLSHSERAVTDEQRGIFAGFLARRKNGEPISYIIGEKEFWGMRFFVTPDVLIPRPETECLIEEVLRFYTAPAADLRLCDIGTGSGIIAIVLAKEFTQARVAATDISPGALAVAGRNARYHAVAGRVDFLEADILAGVFGDFDVICSNPPYITDNGYALLPEGIRNFEPCGALRAGKDGLNAYRKIVAEAPQRLKVGGRLFLEIGEGQKDAVISLLTEEGSYGYVHCRCDYGGVERVVSAKRI